MDCNKMRRMLVTHSVLDITTGVETPLNAEWITQRCSIPLFSDAERERGICKSCNAGWIHPFNFPVDDDEQDNQP